MAITVRKVAGSINSIVNASQSVHDATMGRRLRVCLFAAIFTTVIGVRLAYPQPPMVKRALPPEITSILEHADIFTLFSLNPQMAEKTAKAEFQGYPLLGKVKVPTGSQRTNLLFALYDGGANGSAGAHCFNPRHGIRASQGTNTVELLICFQCGQIYVFSGKTNWMFATTEAPAGAFNAYLKKSKVSLPKQ